MIGIERSPDHSIEPDFRIGVLSLCRFFIGLCSSQIALYLHDGRAETVAAAVAFHGGEGLDAARQFQGLSLRERRQVELFLLSLAALAH